MTINPGSGFAATKPLPTLSRSRDSYLRMTLAEFMALPLRHLLTALDPGTEGDADLNTRVEAISGYTEWVGGAVPAASLGWDWTLGWRSDLVHCVRSSDPRSNIMLVDAQFRDVGPTWTAQLLGGVVDRLDWQGPALQELRAGYSGADPSNLTVTL